MTLEEKILNCFNSHFDRWDGDEKAATKELLLLILQEKVELLRPLLSDKFVYETTEKKISELNNQILNLKN